MAVAIDSWSNVASSVSGPPPRMTTTTSRSSGRPSVAMAARDHVRPPRVALDAHVDDPQLERRARCARARARSRPTPHWPVLVTTPTRSGATDSGTARLASNRPVATRRRTTSSRWMASSPSVKRGSMPVIFRPSWPTGGEEVEVAEDAHLQPVAELAAGACGSIGRRRMRALAKNCDVDAWPCRPRSSTSTRLK